MANWKHLTIAETFAPENEGVAGRTVGEIAAERGQEPFDALCDIADRRRAPHRAGCPASGSDDDASWKMRLEVWRDPRAVLGASDAGAHLDMIDSFTYTTALLGQSVRERQLLPLEEAVHLLTDVPARLYGLRGRGRIEEGWHADSSCSTTTGSVRARSYTRYDLPAGAGRLYGEADGIEHVLVNGVEIATAGDVHRRPRRARCCARAATPTPSRCRGAPAAASTRAARTVPCLKPSSSPPPVRRSAAPTRARSSTCAPTTSAPPSSRPSSTRCPRSTRRRSRT